MASTKTPPVATAINAHEVLDDMFLVLTAKEQEVVVRRYSLNDQPRETLEKIGRSFNVTRERVRQIENSALNKLRRTLDNTKLRHVIRVAKEVLEENDGLMLEKKLTEEVLTRLPNAELHENIVRLTLAVDEDVIRVKKSNEFKPAWRLDRVKEKYIKDASRSILKFLNTKSDVLPAADISSEVRKTLAFKPSTKFVRAVMDIHKAVKATGDDKYGLMTWRHINPKSIKDKCFIVLKRNAKPMHFVEIAQSILDSQFDHKRVTVQAVHNELIRGEQFVLVGRGLYALRDWGYVEGTVGDVIERILKKANKPLSKSEIVKRVLGVRQVKVGTIALNLQKNPKFVRVGRAVYALAE